MCKVRFWCILDTWNSKCYGEVSESNANGQAAVDVFPTRELISQQAVFKEWTHFCDQIATCSLQCCRGCGTGLSRIALSKWTPCLIAAALQHAHPPHFQPQILRWTPDSSHRSLRPSDPERSRRIISRSDAR